MIFYCYLLVLYCIIWSCCVIFQYGCNILLVYIILCSMSFVLYWLFNAQRSCVSATALAQKIRINTSSECAAFALIASGVAVAHMGCMALGPCIAFPARMFALSLPVLLEVLGCWRPLGAFCFVLVCLCFALVCLACVRVCSGRILFSWSINKHELHLKVSALSV